jgi:hypothetical protein
MFNAEIRLAVLQTPAPTCARVVPTEAYTLNNRYSRLDRHEGPTVR